jgi:hypothetical protein
VGVYFLSETAQIANHQRCLQRLDLPTLDPTNQNALRRPFSGVGASNVSSSLRRVRSSQTR